VHIPWSVSPVLSLPGHAILGIGEDVRPQVISLRNPCAQIDNFSKGRVLVVLDNGPNGELVRKSEIITEVLVGGSVRSGDSIDVKLPDPPLFAA